MTDYWQTIPAESLFLHRWSARALVYNDISGHTHLMDEMTTVALERLMTGPQSAADLIAYLGTLFELPADQKLIDWVCNALIRLERLGLVESTPP